MLLPAAAADVYAVWLHCAAGAAHSNTGDNPSGHVCVSASQSASATNLGRKQCVAMGGWQTMGNPQQKSCLNFNCLQTCGLSVILPYLLAVRLFDMIFVQGAGLATPTPWHKFQPNLYGQSSKPLRKGFKLPIVLFLGFCGNTPLRARVRVRPGRGTQGCMPRGNKAVRGGF